MAPNSVSVLILKHWHGLVNDCRLFQLYYNRPRLLVLPINRSNSTYCCYKYRIISTLATSIPPAFIALSIDITSKSSQKVRVITQKVRVHVPSPQNPLSSFLSMLLPDKNSSHLLTHHNSVCSHSLTLGSC